jgi:hypothetical protein
MQMSGEHPLPAKGLFAALGSLFAIIGVALCIGGLRLVVDAFASSFVFEFIAIIAVATIIGFLLRRLPTVWIFLSGILIGFLGSGIIVIRFTLSI